MDLIIIYALSIVFSNAVFIESALSFNKKLADKGYKIKENKENKEKRKLKTSPIISLIPIVNIVYPVIVRIINQFLGERAIDQLIVQDKIESMTPLEKEIYKQKPTMLNSVLAVAKTKNEEILTDIPHITFIDEDINTIYYKIENGYPVVLKAVGPVAQKDKINQRAILIEKLGKFKYVTRNGVDYAYEGTEGILFNLVHMPEDKRQKQIEELKKLKEELFPEEQNDISVQNGHAKVKR